MSLGISRSQQASRAFMIYSLIIVLSLVNSALCLSVHRHPSVHRRQVVLHHRSLSGPFDEEIDGIQGENDKTLLDLLSDSRRSFVRNGFITLSATFTGGSSSNARGLVRFPCNDQPLLNTYHFMRAGSSLLEVEDVWSTNPLFLTNREAALSEIGDDEVRRACSQLKNMGITPTIVRYSLAASSIDTANIVGEVFNIGRDRLVPEFNYLDPRAIGAWDFSRKNVTEEAVWAMDVDEAGESGRGGRPPANEDGTPAETLSDQVVRLTNLMSVLETLYSGDEILLVFPDGTGPALLSCLIGGIPLNRVHELNFRSGEIRANVDYSGVNAIAAELPPSYYSEILQRGRQELRQLRENPDTERNIKDLKFEEERALAEAQKKEQQELERRQASQAELERKQQLEEERRIKEEQRKERQIQAKQKEMERRKSREENADKNTSDMGVIGGVVAGGVILAASSVLANSKESEIVDNDTGKTNDKVILSNVTISDDESVDVEESETILSDVANADFNSTESNQPIAIELNKTSENAKVSESAAEMNTIDEQTSLEEQNATSVEVFDGTSEINCNDEQASSLEVDYDDWGDAWLGTIQDIMNDDPDVPPQEEFSE